MLHLTRYSYLKWLATVLGVLTLLTSSLVAAPPKESTGTKSAVQSSDFDSYVDANSLFMFVSNTGQYARDLGWLFGWGYGTFYPFTSIENIQNGSNTSSPLFAAGLWLGGKVSGQTRVAVAQWDTEFVPGPMSGGSYLPDDTAFRIYKLYSDSLGENPNPDYLQWPADQGAPVDVLGNPRMYGDQMLWCVFNDADTAMHWSDAGKTDPLGIEIRQTVAAYDSGSEIIIEWVLYNRGGHTIDSMYVGYWFDYDLGELTDDLIGCSSSGNLLYVYNADNDDAVYGNRPPACGMKVLRGPLVPSPGDTAGFRNTRVPDFRNLGLTSVIANIDPLSADQTYNHLTGKLADGSSYYDPYTASPDEFMYDGNPLNGSGDLDHGPGDRNVLGASGPFTMAPGDSQYVSIVIAADQGGDRLGSVSALFYNLSQYSSDPPCCEGMVGNLDNDPADQVTLGDLAAMIDILFISFGDPFCWSEANVSLSGGIDMLDLSLLIDHLFVSLEDLHACP